MSDAQSMSDLFHYWSGEPVRVGDVIRCAGKDAVVEMVIRPGTQDSLDYACPGGGVMHMSDAYGYVLENPDSVGWEDVVFIRRA